MNKYLLFFLPALVLSLSQCESTQNKSSTGGTQVVVANPLLGGYDSQVEWGKHIVTISGCNDCHTPKKMTDMGPIIDTSLTPVSYTHLDVYKRQDSLQTGFVIRHFMISDS